MKVQKSEVRSAEVKGCPFCGKKPEISKVPSGDWFIGCLGAKCRMRPSEYFQSKEKAIAEWNTRAEIK